MPEAALEVLVEAIVREALPNALYRVELQTETRGTATAHVGRGRRRSCACCRGTRWWWSSCPTT